MKKSIYVALVSTVLGATPSFAEVKDLDCLKISLAVKQVVASEQSKVLEIVSTEVASAPSCSCEIVKAAIEGSDANVDTVAAIVEAAATAAPEQMRLISQCAVAVAPDALAKVQAVLAKLDPNLGESGTSTKSAKDSKAPAGEVAAMPNPLDFPGEGPVGPTSGGPGGLPLFPLIPPIIINPPDIINPPPVSDTGPLTNG